MNFLGIGPFELLLVMVIATIVLGPERMAQAGRTLGRLYAQYRVRWQRDVDEMTRELRRELEMLQQEVEEIRQTAESEIKSAQAIVQDAVDAVDTEIRDTQTALKGTQAAVESAVDAVGDEIEETQAVLKRVTEVQEEQEADLVDKEALAEPADDVSPRIGVDVGSGEVDEADAQEQGRELVSSEIEEDKVDK
jgi:sec-independent protein translocase protein TatB